MTPFDPGDPRFREYGLAPVTDPRDEELDGYVADVVCGPPSKD